MKENNIDGLPVIQQGQTITSMGDTRTAEQKAEDARKVQQEIEDIFSALMDTTPQASFDWDQSKTPNILRDIMALAEKPVAKEFLALSSLVAFGSLFSNVTFDYGVNINQHLQLYLVGVAPSGGGKSNLTSIRRLFQKVHDTQRENSKIERKEWLKAQSEGKDTPPPANKMFFIPGDTTFAALIDNVNENEGNGLILESELDILTQAIKGKFGGFTTFLRNNFQGEAYASARKVNREYIEINDPHLAMAVTCTPNQLRGLFDKMAIENGTYSRFLFYNLATENAWSDPFDVNMSESVIKELQIRIQSLGIKCNARKHKVLISKDTQNKFNDFMRDTYNEYIQVMTTELQSCIFRMGIIFFRVATIYTILEHEYETLEDCFALSANSMVFAKDFVSVMLANTYKTYTYLSEDKHSESSEQKILGWEILEKLGGIFTTQQANEYGNKETIKRYLRNWVVNGVVEKKAHGIYAKIEQ